LPDTWNIVVRNNIPQSTLQHWELIINPISKYDRAIFYYKPIKPNKSIIIIVNFKWALQIIKFQP
jgi:hypothetical protein